ncbi:MAG: hypothetical protein LH628_13680 [Microcoleus sp. CAN_BIN18]|nr:hypothetical protein [Microcoleus sp. CAN_BIN18]
MSQNEGRRKKEEGRRKKEEGRRKMEDGRWKMEDGRWKMEDGRWKMEDGRSPDRLISSFAIGRDRSQSRPNPFSSSGKFPAN